MWTRKGPTTHGRRANYQTDPTYLSWACMKRRCNDPKTPNYRHYGGRGIRVCQRWDKFENFLADMGERPTRGHTIDRIDHEGNYEPDNCRWVTQTEQLRNTRSNVMLTINGETRCVSAWAEISGSNPTRIHARLKRGWEPVRAVFEPKRIRNS